MDVGFWRAVLGYAPMADDNAVDPLGHGSTVWMQELDEAKSLRHAMHLDVSVAREHLEARLAAALAEGGRIVDESNAPSTWTLADRAGNRVDITAWPTSVTRMTMNVTSRMRFPPREAGGQGERSGQRDRPSKAGPADDRREPPREARVGPGGDPARRSGQEAGREDPGESRDDDDRADEQADPDDLGRRPPPTSPMTSGRPSR